MERSRTEGRDSRDDNVVRTDRAEALFLLEVREGLRRIGAHCLRVENSLMPGTPDLNVCCSGVEFWLEGKVVRGGANARGTITPRALRSSQRVWLRDRWAAGGLAFILLRILGDEGRSNWTCLIDGGRAAEYYRRGSIHNFVLGISRAAWQDDVPWDDLVTVVRRARQERDE